MFSQQRFWRMRIRKGASAARRKMPANVCCTFKQGRIGSKNRCWSRKYWSGEDEDGIVGFIVTNTCGKTRISTESSVVCYLNSLASDNVIPLPPTTSTSTSTSSISKMSSRRLQSDTTRLSDSKRSPSRDCHRGAVVITCLSPSARRRTSSLYSKKPFVRLDRSDCAGRLVRIIVLDQMLGDEKTFGCVEYGLNDIVLS